MKSLALVLLALAACFHNDVALGGPATLVRVDPLAPGAACAGGGVAIRTGLDRNGNGYLDDDEITSTQDVCNGASPVQCAGGTVQPGPVTVARRADADALAGVDCVDGDLLITGLTGDDLGSMTSLAVVTGDVVVAGNAGLTDLTGLGGLREIGGQYVVQGNDQLTDLTGLGALTQADAITIVGNDHLASLAGLPTTADVHLTYRIANNPALTSLSGLDALRTDDKGISILDNAALTSLDALAGLREVGSLEIDGNPQLTALALPALTKIDVNFIANSNAALADASFPALVTAEFVRFQDDAVLARVSAPALRTAAGLDLTRDTALAHVDLPAMGYLTGGIDLVTAPALVDVDASSLTVIGGDLTFVQVGTLQRFPHFAALSTIGGNLTLSSNSAQLDFGGLGALTTIAGDMTVTGDGVLASMNGLDGLGEIGGALTITGNPSLPTSAAQGFAARVNVRGTTTISGNR